MLPKKFTRTCAFLKYLLCQKTVLDSNRG
jgi:hypothetical protein